MSENGATKKRRQTLTQDTSPTQNTSIDIASWQPPADLENWDDKVAEVDTVEKVDNGLILVYLHW